MDSLVLKLKILKKEVISWTKIQKKKDKENFYNIDKQVKGIIENNNDFILNEEERMAIRDLENRRYSLLKKEKMELRLKSRAFWVALGDNNTRFFHNYASGKRN